MSKGTELLNGHFYFKILPDGAVDRSKAFCRHCNFGFCYHRSTSSLKYHLHAKHRVDVSSSFNERKDQFRRCLTPLNARSGTTAENQRQEEITNAIAKWLAADCRPVSVVDDVGLRNLFRIATNDRRYVIPSRCIITRRLHELHDEELTAKETTLQQHAPSERQANVSSKKRKILSDCSSSGEEEPSQILAPIEDADLDESFNLRPWHDSKSQTLPHPEKTPAWISSTNGVDVKVERDQEHDVDAATFWGHCNTAGCTDAIFGDFLNYMKDVSLRIQNEQASQQDFVVAFKVMMASGKMTELLRKQEKALEQKQAAVEKSLAAMREVTSLLKS
ncbi:uncharacterized protein LOC109530642 isoform X1 [Hippocampus comes]|uniref:uncharacterized protein LOC109530642 isoform X1 n=1 Tax=Hippocampus comes TaxID=109280 RepID=UPI00094F38D2|nr:PREDICTED: uncharacterized protein LOC109530642 isoform X1 [Hippocampus comes]